MKFGTKLFIVKTICVAITFHFPISLYPQSEKGLGVDVALYTYNEPGLHYSVFYHWTIKKLLILSTGVSIFNNELRAGWDSGNNSYYSINEKNTRFNGYLSPAFIIPAFKNVGIQFSGSVLFEIVPFNYISVDKSTNKQNGNQTKSVGKYVFTQFNPGVFGDAGIYYDLNKKGTKLRIICSAGHGFYDPVADYRRATIAGQKLSNHISEKKSAKRITLKLIGYL